LRRNDWNEIRIRKALIGTQAVPDVIGKRDASLERMKEILSTL
jgi:hypothetical protein